MLEGLQHCAESVQKEILLVTPRTDPECVGFRFATNPQLSRMDSSGFTSAENLTPSN